MNTTIFSEIKKEILSNGITFLHNYNPNQPIVSIVIFLKMGEIYEPKKFEGISDLLQSVIVKGTKNRSAEQIAEEVESLGGSISADASEDYSTLSIAMGSQHFEKAVDILSDIFKNPTFPKSEIEKEKINIIASIISRKDKIFDIAIDELLSNLYGKKHPYGRRPIDSIKTIKKFSQKNLFNWWTRFYGVDKNEKNIVIVVSGDVSYDVAKEMILKYFSDIPEINLPKIVSPNMKIRNKYIKKKVHFKQGYLMYGFVSPKISKDTLSDYLSLKLINAYLGGGMSGKLFEYLREQHSLCYEINSFYPTRLLDSHFVVYFGLDYGRIDIAKKEIDKIFYQIINGELITEDDLNEVKRKIKGRYLLDHQTNLQQAWYLGFWEIMGMGYEYDQQYIKDLENISLSNIRYVVKKIFGSPKTIIELVPKKK
jgi:predicted Zn-dependent peptidase